MSTTTPPDDATLQKIHAARISQRSLDQLIGVCEFALQDGHIDQQEAEAIFSWLREHREVLDNWPARILYDRLRAMLADGVLDSDEERELLDLVMQIARPRCEDGTRPTCSLPLTQPYPAIVVPERRFCFTGVFDFGSRADCHAAVQSLGGIPVDTVTKKLHYLVIGKVGSELWRHTSFGTKILKAVEYHEAGVPLVIVSEDHWRKALP